MGAKKFGMPLETREIKLFWRDIPGFCRDIPELPEKFEKKTFVFNLRSLKTAAKQPEQPKNSCFDRWTFRIFFIFFLLGGGEGEAQGAEKGEDDFLLKNPRKGGGSPGWVGLGGGGRVFAGN